MSTLTGGDLNLVKPELTDDHKVTIGTDLPANFQKIDDEFTRHQADNAKYSATMQNGFTGYVDYEKDAHGMVTMIVSLVNIPTVTAGTVVANIPAGYRPKVPIPVAVLKGNIIPYNNALDLTIWPNGDVILARENTLSVSSDASVFGGVAYRAYA